MGCFDFYFRRFCCRVCYRVFLGVGLVTLYLDFLGGGVGVVVFEGLILVKSTLVKVKVYHSLDFS